MLPTSKTVSSRFSSLPKVAKTKIKKWHTVSSRLSETNPYSEKLHLLSSPPAFGHKLAADVLLLLSLLPLLLSLSLSLSLSLLPLLQLLSLLPPLPLPLLLLRLDLQLMWARSRACELAGSGRCTHMPSYHPSLGALLLPSLRLVAAAPLLGLCTIVTRAFSALRAGSPPLAGPSRRLASGLLTTGKQMSK